MNIKHWSKGGVDLYLGDSLELLPGLPATVEALITDPPYSSGGTTAYERSRPPADKYVDTDIRPGFLGDNKDQRSWTKWCSIWLALDVHGAARREPWPPDMSPAECMQAWLKA